MLPVWNTIFFFNSWIYFSRPQALVAALLR